MYDEEHENTKRLNCTIVLVNWNSAAYLIECIKSIRTFTRCSHEIIVVDNNSCAEDKEILVGIEDIRLLLNDRNNGFAAANNQGIRWANGDYIFLLNPDTKLMNDAIDQMISYLNANDNFSAIGPKLYYSELCDYHPSVKSLDSPIYNLFFLIPGSLYVRKVSQFVILKLNRTLEVKCLIGAAILFRKTVFEKVGLLDEQFFLYSEEVDLFMRMQLIGLKTVYYPRAQVIHYGGKSQGESSVGKLYYLWTSKISYFRKHYNNLNVALSLFLMYVVLKIKIIFTNKTNLVPVCELIIASLKKNNK